jgi:hypothetical protein
MSDLIRSLCCRTCEQEQRENQRNISRLIRASRQSALTGGSFYTPPSIPAGTNIIKPIYIVNMPRSIKT